MIVFVTRPALHSIKHSVLEEEAIERMRETLLKSLDDSNFPTSLKSYLLEGTIPEEGGEAFVNRLSLKGVPKLFDSRRIASQTMMGFPLAFHADSEAKWGVKSISRRGEEEEALLEIYLALTSS